MLFFIDFGSIIGDRCLFYVGFAVNLAGRRRVVILFWYARSVLSVVLRSVNFCRARWLLEGTRFFGLSIFRVSVVGAYYGMFWW